MRVIGLDLSYAATGATWSSCGQEFDCATISTATADGDWQERAEMVRDSVLEVCHAEDVDLVVIEASAFAAPRFGHQMGTLSGVVKAGLNENGHPIATVSPLGLKKFATENGSHKTTKRDIKMALQGLGVKPVNEHVNDALVLCCMGLAKYDVQTVFHPLTVQRIEALHRMRLPTV